METLTIILIVAIIWIYVHFNTRLKSLEEQLNNLKQQDKKPSVIEENKPIEPKPEEKPIEINPESHTPEIPKPVFQQAVLRQEPNILDQKITQITSFLKQNALSVIGIFTLVLGIGYFVKYAIDRNWIGESGRVAIGFITGLALIGLGNWLRKNYTIFSSIITGGGISVFYLTVTIAFREYTMFSQNIAFGILSLITLFSIALAYYYKSEVLNIVALIGGFLAPLMVSTGESNYLFLFSYISILNIGMLIIAYLRNWKSIGWIAFFFTSIYFLSWIIVTPSVNAVYFILASYAIFYAFALQSYFKKNSISTESILMLILINLFSLVSLIYILKTLNYEGFTIFPIGFAVINGFLAFKEKSKNTSTSNFAVFVAITISLISIAVALELKAHFITAIWAIEASLLLFIWKKTGQKIFKQSFNILFPFVIIAQIVTWSEYYSDKNLLIIINPVFLTSAVVIGSLLFNLFYIKNLNDESEDQSKFQYVKFFAGLSYLVIYLSISFEIWYHIQDQPETFITCIILLYTICFVFIMLLLRTVFDLQTAFVDALIYILLIVLCLNATLPDISYSIFTNEISKSFYLVYLLYWIPFLVTIFYIIPKTKLLTESIAYWALGFVSVLLISCEIYHLYMLLKLTNIEGITHLQNHFTALYLPIIWTIMAASFIYFGLQKSKPEMNKIGFSLIAITIAKLYLYDVWLMDNISRIIAFIVLGVLLLFSSFLFQRLKKIIGSMVETKDKNSGTEDDSN